MRLKREQFKGKWYPSRSSIYFTARKKCCTHSFNCMAFSLRSVKCQYFLF